MILGGGEILRLIQIRPPLVEGWIDLETQLQPAGFDLTLREVRKFKSAGHIDFSNRRRRIADTTPIPFDDEGQVALHPGPYLAVFNEVVNIPLNVIAIARPRSSLLRCGVTVETAVWDPGYRGRSRALLLVHNDKGVVLEKNARIVQLVFMRVEGVSKGYRGAYQGEE